MDKIKEIIKLNRYNPDRTVLMCFILALIIQLISFALIEQRFLTLILKATEKY